MANPYFEKIFSVPIHSCIVGNLDKVTQEIDQSIDSIKFSMIENWGSTHYLSDVNFEEDAICLLYTSPSPRDRTRSRMPSSA